MSITFGNYLELAFTKSLLLFYFSVAPAQNCQKMNRASLMRFEFVIRCDGYYKQCISTDLKTMVLVLNQRVQL